MKTYIIINIVIIIAIVILFYILKIKSKSEATYVKSDVTGKNYLVQNYPDKEEAAYVLGIIDKRIGILRNYLETHMDSYPEFKPYIKQFCSRIKHVTLYENAPDGRYTSFTVNKGDEIALCLRSKQTKQIHDINLIMYVTLHELAHVACPEVNHTKLFKRIFVFLLNISIEIKIYKYTNYERIPAVYCGMTIDEDLLRK